MYTPLSAAGDEKAQPREVRERIVDRFCVVQYIAAVRALRGVGRRDFRSLDEVGRGDPRTRFQNEIEIKRSPNWTNQLQVRLTV
jgi:hypothetical protein